MLGATRDELLGGASDPRVLAASMVVLPLIGFALVVHRQVYAKIGADGIYYGFKLGRGVPWCRDFPFSCMRHPQYYASMMIFVALLLTVSLFRPAGTGLAFSVASVSLSVPADLAFVILYQLWLYAVTAVMEESGDADDAKAA